VRERRARQRKFLRKEILDAASELFVRNGFENVSMRRIADKIEYSPTTIYLYFRDKAELLDEVCRETFAKLLDVLSKIIDQPGDPLERLGRGLHAYIEFGLANPHHYRATFMMPMPDGLDAGQYTQQDSAGMRAFDFLRRSVYDGVVAGKMRVRDPEAASQILWAGVHGITSLLIIHEQFPWVERGRLIDSMVETLLAGVRA
jgi:AcrR family transcriptional regulator